MRLSHLVQGDSQYAKDLHYLLEVDHKWYNMAKEITHFLWPGPEGVERFITPSNMRKDVDPKDVAIADGWARDCFKLANDMDRKAPKDLVELARKIDHGGPKAKETLHKMIAYTSNKH